MDLPIDFSPLRFSTDDLPSRDRVPAWRDFFGRMVFRSEIEPAPGAPFRVDMAVRALPGLFLASSSISPLRLLRTPPLAADGNDDIGFSISSSRGAISQLGHEVSYGPGDAVLAMADQAAKWAAASPARIVCLHVHRAELAPLVTNLDPAAVLRLVPPDSEALQYLLGYIRFLQDRGTTMNEDLARAAAVHVRDLFALVLGATRDGTVLAEGRGLRAARLQAIKRHIADNLGAGRLTVGEVAARHRVAPRYVQRLFESEGTTFSEYVLNERLALAFRKLADPAHASWTVSAIALDAGFGDVSYFNRCFRRRFGMRPSDARQTGQHDT